MDDRASRSTRPTGHGDAGDAAGDPERGRYELVRELGRGAMGTVWLARDRALDREVAVKLLHDRFLSDVHQQRLAAEARAMARLSHPNVVAVYDVGERDGRTFVAMELVRGEPLSRWLATPRTWREVVEVFRAVGEGLAAAHAAGLVHRDVKPSNILLGDDGRPRLADFGVAHASRAPGEPATTATATAGPIGSPAYMPPERLIGDAGGARGDQFGFCASLYEALHGRRPFLGDREDEIVEAVLRGPPPPVRPVPRWLHAVVARGLAADASVRFPSMDAVVAALRAGPRRRARVLGLVVAGGLATAGVVGVATANGRGGAAHPPADAAVVAAAPSVPPPAAAPDAAPAAAGAPDAAPAAGGAPDADPRPARAARDPAAGLSLDEVRARLGELRAEYQAATARGALRAARAIAERTVPYARRLGSWEPYQWIMVMSCRLGDEPAARAALRALPRGASGAYLRQEMIAACRMHGMELGDAQE